MVVRPNRFGVGTGFGTAIRYTWPDLGGSTGTLSVASVMPVTVIAASLFEYFGPPKSRNSYLIPASIRYTWPDLGGSTGTLSVASVMPVTVIAASLFEYFGPPKSRNSYLIPASI